MLTKDLLRYRNRKDRVQPTLIKVNDPTLLALAEGMIGIFVAAPGSRLADLEDELSASVWADHALMPAFKKLLLDRCDEVEDDGIVAARRGEFLQAAETLRRGADYPSLEAYQAALGSQLAAPVAELQEQLYADLPECRLLKTFETLTALALLHRYNCAQIQGLLMVAQELTVRISGASLVEKRRFFRCLKFQRLLGDVGLEESDSETICKLSGPLKIFQNSQSYGLRLAQFFPYILQLPRWQLQAEVKLTGKIYTLELDDKVGIQSHYKKFTPFVPPELTAFITAFNERGQAFSAAIGAEYLAIGQQSYCFPDVTFTGAGGEIVHMEIFHKWHAGQLAGRLKALAAAPKLPLVIGVAQDIASSKDLEPLLEASAWFGVHGFVFKNLPTPKAIQQVLLRHTAARAGQGGKNSVLVDAPSCRQ